MPTFRAIIERTVVSREIIELNAPNLRDAARRVDEFTADRTKSRGITVSRPHDDDPTATQDERPVQILERP